MLLLGKKWANFGDLSDFTNLMNSGYFLHYYQSPSTHLVLIDAKQRFIVSVFMTLSSLLHKKSASPTACTLYQKCC